MINEAVAKIQSMILTFKLILVLNNNWEEYKLSGKYKLRNVEIKEVEKMLMCMDMERGYTTYICEECGKTKRIPHSCKSRICSSCGKRHADEWAEKINAEMYAVPYRHIILTVSNKLWKYFEGSARMQKLMMDVAAGVMKEIVKKFNKQKKEIEPGIIMVLHPFGRDLKTNMHVHMLMTEGGLSPDGKWVAMPYIDYKIIRRKWQYAILTAMRKAMPKDKELAEIIDWCFRERTNGFNIQAKKTIEGKTRNAARYMARYVRHPAIADSRIIGYNKEKVTFIYKREGKTCTVIMDKFEFIHNVIKHIPDENFKMVRYFGIHARRAKRKAREVMEKLGKVIKYLIRPFSWRKNVTEYNGKDPLACDKCGGHMVLCKVTYRDKYGEMREYNRLNSIIRGMEAEKTIHEKEEKEKRVAFRGENEKHCQLCVF